MPAPRIYHKIRLTLPSGATLCECHGHVTLNYSVTGQVLEEVMDTKYLGVTTWSGCCLPRPGPSSSQSRFPLSR